MKYKIDYSNIEFNGNDIHLRRVPIWKDKKSFFDLCDTGTLTEDEGLAFMKKRENEIISHVEWLENNKRLICDKMIGDGILDLAIDWNIQAAEQEDPTIKDLTEEEFDKRFAITNEEFLASLANCDTMVDFSEGEFVNFHLEILLDPDYFNGHFIHVHVDKDKTIMVEGL